MPHIFLYCSEYVAKQDTAAPTNVTVEMTTSNIDDREAIEAATVKTAEEIIMDEETRCSVHGPYARKISKLVAKFMVDLALLTTDEARMNLQYRTVEVIDTLERELKGLHCTECNQ